VLATFLHRLVRFAQLQPELAHVIADPFGAAAGPPSRGQRWRQRLRSDGLWGTARHLLARLLLGPRVGSPRVEEGYLLMQLRAAHGFFSGLDSVEERRRTLEQQRVVTDREIVARFPRLVVPTYAGDEEWFDSEAFTSLLPKTWALEHRELEEVLHPSVLKRAR
jgi:hypothetical protein